MKKNIRYNIVLCTFSHRKRRSRPALGGGRRTCAQARLRASAGHDGLLQIRRLSARQAARLLRPDASRELRQLLEL